MVTYFLLFAILLSALLFMKTDQKKETKLYLLFKPLTTILIIVFCFIQPSQVSVFYKNLILIGLFFSLIGDIFLMLPSDRFISGLISFLIAHLFYISAFTGVSGWHLNWVYFIPVFLYTVFLLKAILPGAGSKRIPVIIYATVLSVFLWQAVGRLDFSLSQSAALAFSGAVLFVLSDSILAYTRFAKKFRFSQELKMITYWSAQVLIAASV